MEIQIEFGGFYGYHEEYIDCKIEQFNDSVIYEDEIIDYNNVDWDATFKEYAKNWLWRFNNISNLDLEFISVNSPKFYNFRTDRIIANVPNECADKMLQYTKMEDFKQYANGQLTSHNGYVSFFDNIDDLVIKAYKSDNDMALLLGLICDYIIDLEEINEYIYELEYEIIELTDKTTDNE